MLHNMIPATIVQGHRVASGLNGDPRFPGGTLRMQLPFFRHLGLDLSEFHLATINVSIAPLSYRIVHSKATFRDVKWHASEPVEDFSFIDVTVYRETESPLEGLIYYPHPDTKPEHFQKPDVLELILPLIQDVHYGSKILLNVPPDQMTFSHP